MNTLKHPIYYAARITIECQSPLSIKDTNTDPTLDVTLFRDAYGNPTMPGTSIAGVLNHLAQSQGLCHSLFGQAGEPQSDLPEQDNYFSRVTTSFGFVHDEHNQVQKGSIQHHTPSNDSLISYLANTTPILRDQVKLTENATAQDQAKFDVAAIPKGTRFTFELGLACTPQNTEKNQQDWDSLIALVKHPLFRLGALTRRGFGQVKVVAIKKKMFDFTQPTDLKEWKNWQRSTWQPEVNTYKTEAIVSNATNAHQQINLSLQAEDFWRIGDGSSTLQPSTVKEPDLKPYTETVVEWHAVNHKGNLKYQQVTVPATGLKGALRHRTLFHLRRNAQDWDGSQYNDTNLAPLFGQEADHDKQTGNVGAIIINDIYPKITDIAKQTKVMMHNAIDRFTGGTINGALFSEELIYQGQLDCTIIFDTQRLASIPKDKFIPLFEAFSQALNDLAHGQLSLGAGSAKGHGYFNAVNAQQLQQDLEDIRNNLPIEQKSGGKK